MNEQDRQQTPTTEPAPGHPVTLSPAQPVSARLGRLGRLVRKELNEILRDRRTIITLILMPLLLYPLLSMAFQQFALAGLRPPEKARYKIAVFNPVTVAARMLAATATTLGHAPLGAVAHSLSEAEGQALSVQLQYRESAEQTREPPPEIFVAPTRRDLEKEVRSGGIHLGIAIRPGKPDSGPSPFLLADWELLYVERSPQGQEALAYVERHTAALNVFWLQWQLATEGWGRRTAPLRLSHTSIQEARQEAGLSRSALVPLILILMTITGAVYPAIDLTAGERERGTLEILVAAPVPRLALLFAKYVSVVTVAVLTALVNLVMMLGTLQLTGLGREVFGGGLTVGLVLALFGLLLLFAAFFSAVLLALTSFARSFKEAQAYLIPLMLVSLAPGLIGMMPGLKLEGLYAVTPLLNIVLLARDLLDAKAAVEPALAAVVILSTSVYALAAIALAARIFGAEGVLYSEQGNWSDLFRRPARPRATPTLTSALGCLALLFPAYFVVASLLRWAPLEERQWLQVLATFVLFALLPLLAAFRGRVRVVSAFRLRGGTWIAYPAAVLLGLGLVPVVYEMLAVLRAERLTFFGREQEEQFRKQFEQWRTMSPWLLAGGLAIVGMLEELFFRGYLFSALRSVGGAALTILGSALLFGLFHAPQAFDRLLPSTLLGVVLGWVCWRSGSVLPGMLLHAVYNALPILLVYYNPPTPGESAHWPLEWLGAGFAGVVTGAALLLASGGRKLPDNSENQGA